MAYDTGVRQYLTGKGVNPSDIGYVNGAITLKGQSFLKPTKNYAGTTYDSKQNLDSAWNTYKGSTPTSAAGIAAGMANGNVAPTGVAGTSTATPTTATLPAAGVTPTGTAAPTTTGTTTTPYTSDEVKAAIDALMNYKPEQIDPYQTDAYKAYAAQSDRRAHEGIRAAQESLGSSGFGRSTTLGERSQRVQNQEAEYLNMQVIPQIMAQEQARQQQEHDNKVANVGLLMQKQNQDDQLGVQQGQMTGRYITKEMQGLYAEVDSAKTAWANAKTPEEKAAAHKRADDARARLAALGANVDAVGSNVTQDQERANQGLYGVQTQEAIQNEWNRTHTENRDAVADTQWNKSFGLDETSTMAGLTGFMPDGTPTTAEQQRVLGNLWKTAEETGVVSKELSALTGIPAGTKTLQAQQMLSDNLWKVADTTGVIPDQLATLYGIPKGTKTQQAQQLILTNLWTVAEQTGTIPDQLADLYGIPHGTKTQDAINNDRQYDLNRDASDLAWIKEDFDESQPSGGGAETKTVTGDTAGVLLKKSVTKIIGYTADEQGYKTIPKYGTTTDWETRKKAFVDAYNSSGVAPGADVITMLTKAGYTPDEISKLKEKYPDAFDAAAGK